MGNTKKVFKFVGATKIGKHRWEVECTSSSGTPIKYIDMTPGKKRADVVAWAKRWCEKQNLEDQQEVEAAQLRYRRMMTIRFLLSGGKVSDLGFLEGQSND